VQVTYEMENSRKNTIGLNFRNIYPVPSAYNVHKWIKDTLSFTCDQVDSIQLDSQKGTVYVKLINSLLVEKCMRMRQEELMYEEEQGVFKNVYLTNEDGINTVRIHHYPVDKPNRDIMDVISEYGKVINLNDEVWGRNMPYPVKNGVRAVKLNLKQHVPSYVNIKGIRCLVTYNGQPRTCMICNESEHMRQDCPKRRKFAVPIPENRPEAIQQEEKNTELPNSQPHTRTPSIIQDENMDEPENEISENSLPPFPSRASDNIRMDWSELTEMEEKKRKDAETPRIIDDTASEENYNSICEKISESDSYDEDESKRPSNPKDTKRQRRSVRKSTRSQTAHPLQLPVRIPARTKAPVSKTVVTLTNLNDLVRRTSDENNEKKEFVVTNAHLDKLSFPSSSK
jgi:hypothetical protein